MALSLPGLDLRLPVHLGREFFSWWLRSLAAAVPRSLRHLAGVHQTLVTVSVGESLVSVRCSRAGRSTLLMEADGIDGPIPPSIVGLARSKRTRTSVILPDEHVLVRRLKLPAAAERELDSILPHEIERITPFCLSDVRYDYRIEGRASDGREIVVALAVAKTAIVERALSVANRLGLTPTAVGLASARTNARAFNLLPREPVARSTAARFVNAALLSLLVALGGTIVVRQWIALESEASSLARALDAARAGARRADQLRKDVEKQSTQTGILEKLRSHPDLLEITRELSARLPADSWTSHLTLAGKEVRISGISPNASHLLSSMGSTSAVTNARFRSPIMRQPGGMDRFEIAFDIPGRR